MWCMFRSEKMIINVFKNNGRKFVSFFHSFSIKTLNEIIFQKPRVEYLIVNVLSTLAYF